MFDSLIEGPGEYLYRTDRAVGEESRPFGSADIIYKKNGNVIKGEISHEFDINEAVPGIHGCPSKGPLPLETQVPVIGADAFFAIIRSREPEL